MAKGSGARQAPDFAAGGVWGFFLTNVLRPAMTPRSLAIKVLNDTAEPSIIRPGGALGSPSGLERTS